MDRVLGRNQPTFFSQVAEKTIQSLENTPVKGADGCPINNHPIKQLNPGVRLEHAGFRHAVVIRDAEAMLWFHQHADKLSNQAGTCNRSWRASPNAFVKLEGALPDRPACTR